MTKAHVLHIFSTMHTKKNIYVHLTTQCLSMKFVGIVNIYVSSTVCNS